MKIQSISSGEKRLDLILSDENIILFGGTVMTTSQYSSILQIDSTGYQSLQGCSVEWARRILDQNKDTWIYCATGQEYLFPKSSKNQSKRVRTDKDLVKWWIKTCSIGKKDSYLYIPGETCSSAKQFMPTGVATLNSSLDSSNPLSDTKKGSSNSNESIVSKETARVGSDRLASDGSKEQVQEKEPISSNQKTLWKWGLGLPMAAKASELPSIPDHMITKALLYLDSKTSTVQQVCEMMDCMETHAGLRALLRVKNESRSDSVSDDFTTVVEEKEWNEMMNTLMTCNFDTKEAIEESSQKLLFFFKKPAVAFEFKPFERLPVAKQEPLQENKVHTLSSLLVKKKRKADDPLTAINKKT